MMLIDENGKYYPHQPEYPYWVTLLYIKNLKRLFPEEEIEKLLDTHTENMSFIAKQNIRHCAVELFLNGYI